MKRIDKHTHSEILNKKIIYKDGGDNSELSRILKEEQHNFCAYTEVYISATYSTDIDHFNPTLKNTTNDNYYNWFVISTKWNRKKGKRWNNEQPILHPSANDLEERLWYDDGFYFHKDSEAKNLIDLLELNNNELFNERKKYIERLRTINEKTNLQEYLTRHPEDINFRRAIEKEFGLQF